MDVDSINKVLSGSFLESGWDGFKEKNAELTAEAQHAAALKRFEYAQEIARAYTSPDGKIALARLRASTVNLPTWDPEATGAMDGAAAGFAREGQNSIIREIDRLIAVAAEGPPQPPPKPQDGGNNG